MVPGKCGRWQVSAEQNVPGLFCSARVSLLTDAGERVYRPCCEALLYFLNPSAMPPEDLTQVRGYAFAGIRHPG